MNPFQLLAHLRGLGIRIRAEGGRLRIDAPRDTITSELRELLTRHKSEILEMLAGGGRRIEPVPRDERLCVSFSQERLWFVDRLIPASPGYITPRALRLRGELDREALQRSLDALVERHESLRTTFREGRDGPVQVVGPPGAAPMRVEDLSGTVESEREPELRGRLVSESRTPFDLATGPLFRTVLYRLGEQDHVLLLLMHHIITDGWSIGVIERDLGALYRARRDGREPELPDLPVQYADFAAWQRSWLQGETLTRQLDYWSQHLSGWSTLELPTDRPRPPMQSFHGARESLSLPASLSGSIETLSRDAGATLFMTLLAAFKVLLQRYTGQDDIVVGTPIAGRTQVEVEGLVGFFVNTLALRTDLSGDPSFRDLLDRVKKVALGAIQNQDMPFEKLVQELVPERDLSRNPLFQVSFALQNASATEVGLEGLAVSPVAFDRHNSVFDLSVDVWTDAGGLRVNFAYSTDLFDTTTIRRMADHFKTLLQGVVAEPGTRLSDLPILSKAERHRVLVEWNESPGEFASERCIHELFEAQASRTPDATAVVFEDRRLTYGELNARANQIAHHLRSVGVRTETKVGICMERSPEMVVAILGVLKSGGAYVSLDPSYPKDRVAFMLEDSRAPVLLTQRRLLAQLPDHAAITVCLDSDWNRNSDYGGERLDVAVEPDNLAYVIYTSGSTGRPKGVLLTHRSAVALVRWAQEVFECDDLHGVLASTSICFDLSVYELFVTLSAGGTVILADHALAFPELVARDEVTLVNTVPSAIAELVRQDAIPESVRTVNLAGEPLLPGLVDEIYAVGVERVYDLYGPSETTTYSTFALRERGGPATVGRPVANERVYILDAALGPVPVGVQGELFIGGVGLARGYLNDPVLTAERFIPDPFGGEQGGRLYRTGDLARWRSDGRIEFRGRADHQVKVRGFRIELGEIETVLRDAADVREAVVVCRTDESRGKQLVGYIVPAPGHEPSPSALREWLAERVPDYMIPSAFVLLESMPVTPNGKVDRRALPAPSTERQLDESYVAPRGELESRIAAIWREILKVDEVGVHDNFFDLGGHSLLLWQVRTRLTESIGREVAVIDLFRYPTVVSLAEHLSGEASKNTPLVETARQRVRARQDLAGGVGAVAIVGLACRFPGASDPDRFWDNLRDGVESIRFFSHDESRNGGGADDVFRDPAYVGAKGYLEDADQFDAPFFDCSPREASLIDPQQRFFLECAWEALESAGYDPERYDGRIGVYAGVSMNSYAGNLRSDPDLMRTVGGFNVTVANDKDFVSTRVAYKLNLRGPAINVQTACSTSLVAVHQACQSLLLDECTMALAGGASVTLPLKSGYVYQEGGIMSRDGHCRTFDAAAGGTLAGNGVGVVLLKRLQDAVSDGDPIHAVILGSAINNDGSLKVGFTAPGVEGQAEVIATAQAMAGVDPDTIGYVEAHGTGTALGDPIEVAALTQVFRERTDRRGFCAIGSLKSNVGHMDAAAGVGGLIKTVLALSHGVIPPSLHFREPNPELGIEASPFYVAANLEDWQTGGGPRRAGVSSFGIGGTNAHVVLEEAPPRERSNRSQRPQLLTLSARTGPALEAATANLSRHLERHPELDLADVAWTLQVGRRGFSHRRVLVCSDVAGAVEALRAGDPQRMPTELRKEGERPVIFMFTGQGSQYPNMGRGLYDSQPSYRETVDRCCDILIPGLRFDLREVLFPEDDRLDEAAERIARTEITQPALFVTEYALAQLWMEWGIRPRAMIGHSIGEYVAACLSGEFSLEDGLRLVAARGRLMGSLPGGSMLAVPLPEEDVGPRLPEALSVAAINASGRCVVSGPDDAIEAFAAALEADGTPASRLRTSHAFHSSMMDPILEPFTAEVERTPRSAPSIPYVSNVTGAWKTEDEVADPGYWARHLRSCVRFADGLAGLLSAQPEAILLEVGPGDTLVSLARRHPDRTASHGIVTSVRHPKKDDPDREFLLGALGRLWSEGVEPDWVAIHGGERPNRVCLPTYPFERKRYWIEKRDDVDAPRGRRSLAKNPDVGAWFYVPVWKPTSLIVDGRSDEEEGPERWLVLGGTEGIGDALATKLVAEGCDVVRGGLGSRFAGDGRDEYTLDPDDPDHYGALLDAVAPSDGSRLRVVHAWSVSDGDAKPGSGCESRRNGFYSFLYLVQALAKCSHHAEVAVVTTGVYEVNGEEPLHPETAMLTGLCRVIPQEIAQVSCRTLDVVAADDPGKMDRLAELLIADLRSGSREPAVAYRGTRRWALAYDTLELDGRGSASTALREGGTYLITGGRGRIGLELAEMFARSARVKLVLSGSSPFLPRDAWDRWVEEHGEEDPVSGRIQRVRDIEALGAEVRIVDADVADAVGMRAVITEECGQNLCGVVHAAGTVSGPSFGPLDALDREAFESQFRSKVDGLRVLDEVLAGRPLDFRIVTSSLSTVLGGIRMAAYASANAFMDAFACKSLREGMGSWLSVDWDGWRFDGEPDQTSRQSSAIVRLAMTPEEGVEAFRRVLGARGVPHVIVSTADLTTRLDRWVYLKPDDEPAEATPEERDSLYARPELQTTYVEPRNDTERTLAEIWERLLGIDRVGVDDNFFELGGDSLIGIGLIARAKEAGLEVTANSVFEHQTIAELAEATGTPAAQPAVTEPVAGAEPAPDLVAVDRTSDVPLSFSQQRLWFLDQLDSGSAYNLPFAYRLSGALGLDDLKSAVNALVERHEALRTCFPVVEGSPVQRVRERLEIEIPLIDLGDTAESDHDAEIDRLVQTESDYSFDLARGPLLRTKLARLADREHVLIVNMHHIVSDGWSMDVFFRDLNELYRARHEGRELNLPPLPVQYPDYAVWQRRWMETEVLQEQLEFWRTRLEGLEVLNMPTDRPRPATQTFDGASHGFSLPRELSESLTALSRESGVTPFMTMLATFQTLLHRYTGQDDIVVGSPIANRTRPEVQSLIGLFVNILVMRTDFSDDPRFTELLARVRETTLAGYRHQDLPFERLVDEMEPERDLSQNPLYQVAFIYNASRANLDLSGLGVTPYRIRITNTRFDMEFYVMEVPDGFACNIVYNTDLFDASTTERMGGHFRTLLESVAANPDLRASEVEILGAGERRAVLVDWNRTDVDYPDRDCIHQVVEARAEQTPDALAVAHDACALSYAELNSRANRVAHTLRSLGVGADTPVAVCVERGTEMIVGFLGVLKAGGAYVPIDPTNPSRRLAYLFSDCGASVLLSQRGLLPEFPEFSGRVLCLDREGDDFAAAADDNPPCVSAPENLAYVIYTSGSTGQPKGVAIEHRGLSNLVGWHHERYDVSPEDRATQVAAIGFDACVWELWPYLTSGASVHVVTDEVRADPARLWAWYRDERITLSFVPTPLAEAALRKAMPEDLSLRALLTGGDRLRNGVSDGQLPFALVNHYGPTENTVVATAGEVGDEELPSIGGPIGNVRAYVLDRSLNPVPVGIVGELCLGGSSLARGYLGRADLTAERFVPDPFGDDDRLYRTGDVVRWRPDGTIDFLGRSDHQVKVRGFRIELGEIESVLNGHPGVRESLAMVRDDLPGDDRVVAYVLPDTVAGEAENPTEWNEDQVSHWHNLYEQSYGEATTPQEATFQIAGWNSSYTGEPIPAGDMRQWVDRTVEAILETRPCRVLEIGCGTGLLLFRIVPHCREYLATDFSWAALDYVESQLGELGAGAATVKLEQRRADEFDGIESGRYDTVVLNSVAQYFPSAEYLLQVMDGAVDATRPGGRIFVGDVRCLPLMQTFHASVQLYQADDDTTVDQLRRLIHQQMNQDQELVVHPRFFHALKHANPRVGRVEIYPKAGRYDNEMSRFRYDVVIHVDGDTEETPVAVWLDWTAQGMTLEALRERLHASGPDEVSFTGVPNRRILEDRLVVEMLDDEECPTAVRELRRRVEESAAESPAVDPEDLRALSEEVPYVSFLSWAAGRPDGSFDVVLRRRGSHDPEARPPAFPDPEEVDQPWSSYTNWPLRGRRLRSLLPQLRSYAQEMLPEYMVPSTFVVLDEFPLTPNGKVDRRALPAPDTLRQDLAHEFSAPRTPAEKSLATAWAQVLSIERVGLHDNFFASGGDSILSIQVVVAAREAGFEITSKEMFQHQTIAELARVARDTRDSTGPRADQETVVGVVAPTPIQLWFFEEEIADPQHFNQAFVFELGQAVDPAHLERVFERLISHHDVLRLRARRTKDGWRQEIVAPDGPVALDIVDLTDVPVANRSAHIEKHASGVQASLDLEAGPIIRAALYRGEPDTPEHLLIVVHHLAVDGVSWRILLDDLNRGMEQIRSGKRIQLPPKTTSVRTWADRLAEYGRTPVVAAEAEYWLDLPWNETDALPVDLDGVGENTAGTAATVTVTLDRDRTRALLQDVPGTYNTEINDTLLTALGRTLSSWTGRDHVLVDMEGHGREEVVDGVDLSRTVGWFTTIFPAILRVDPDSDVGAVLRSIKEQLRAVPGRGLAYGLARHLSGDERLQTELRRQLPAELSFNYLGQFDQVLGADTAFRRSGLSAGLHRSPRGRRAHLLEINALVLDGSLRVNWTYETTIHREDTVRGLADRFLDELGDIVEHCGSVESTGYTPSDFAEFEWSETDIEDIVDELKKEE